MRCSIEWGYKRTPEEYREWKKGERRKYPVYYKLLMVMFVTQNSFLSAGTVNHLAALRFCLFKLIEYLGNSCRYLGQKMWGCRNKCHGTMSNCSKPDLCYWWVWCLLKSLAKFSVSVLLTCEVILWPGYMRSGRNSVEEPFWSLWVLLLVVGT